MNQSLIVFFFLFISFSCEKEDDNDPVQGCMDETAINYNPDAEIEDGSCQFDDDLMRINIDFRQFIDDQDVQYSELIYSNAAENLYSVEKLYYVISDLTLHYVNAESSVISNYLFIKNDDPNSLKLNNIIIPDTCSSISFTFGFSQINNESDMYLNDPNNFHNLMVWPDVLGGGYHYMKLEGTFIDIDGEEKFYNTHTGPLNGNDNSYSYSFNINYSQGQSQLYIDMDINKFFNNPVYDHNYYGQGIMGSLEAQSAIKNNLGDVFTVTSN